MLRGVQVQVLLPAYEKTTGDPVVFLFIINLERVNSFEILFLVFAVPKLRGDNSIRRSYSCVRAYEKGDYDRPNSPVQKVST